MVFQFHADLLDAFLFNHCLVRLNLMFRLLKLQVVNELGDRLLPLLGGWLLVAHVRLVLDFLKHPQEVGLIQGARTCYDNLLPLYGICSIDLFWEFYIHPLGFNPSSLG